MSKVSKVKFYPEKCTGCKACMLKCSFLKEGEYNVELARLEIVSNWLDEPGLRICQQCEDAPCIEACPVEAISRGAGGEIIIDGEICINCGICSKECPNDAIREFAGRVFTCDTCQGSFSCVTVCSTEALTCEEGGEDQDV